MKNMTKENVTALFEGTLSGLLNYYSESQHSIVRIESLVDNHLRNALLKHIKKSLNDYAKLDTLGILINFNILAKWYPDLLPLILELYKRNEIYTVELLNCEINITNEFTDSFHYNNEELSSLDDKIFKHKLLSAIGRNITRDVLTLRQFYYVIMEIFNIEYIYHTNTCVLGFMIEIYDRIKDTTEVTSF